MPTYVYLCECTHQFEEIKKITCSDEERDYHKCPECDKLARHVITPVEWRTKGKGWYQNLEKDSNKGEFKHRMWKSD